MGGVLGIHVIGAGFGESIVIEMPNGSVGVLDCFAPRLAASSRHERLQANPTLRFLVDQLKVEKLAFLAFTHPHEDHGRGLTHLLEEFRDRIAQIWVFHGLQTIALERWFEASTKRGLRLPLERLLDEPAGTFSLELARFREIVHQQCDKKNPCRARFRSFCGRKSIRIEGEPLIRIHVLGPSDELVRTYEHLLADNMKGLVSEEKRDGKTNLIINPGWRPERVNHNRSSPACLVEYGETRILLGGDMECEAWQDILDDTAECLNLRCHFVKVSHHESTTGYCNGLYRQFGREPDRPVAVLTPFCRHQFPLPTLEGLRAIRGEVGSLWATNRTEADLAIDLSRVGMGTSEALPERWLLLLDRDPTLASALAPELRDSTVAPDPPESVPFELLPELERDASLVRALHPQLRRKWHRQRHPVSDSPETDCRVAFTFNDHGQEIESLRHIGSLAGECADKA